MSEKNTHQPTQTIADRIQRGKAPIGALTERQAEVLALIALGLNPRQIAKKIGVSPLTVKAHLKNIYRRLGVHNRVNAILRLNPAECPHCGYIPQNIVSKYMGIGVGESEMSKAELPG